MTVTVKQEKFELITTIITKQSKEYSFTTYHDTEREASEKMLQHRFTLEGDPESPFGLRKYFTTRVFMINKEEVSSVEFYIK